MSAARFSVAGPLVTSLRYFWRQHLAVGLGAAVATAVLAGALLVGDSVQGSLRDLARDRLGRIDDAVTAPRLFREALATDVTEALGGDALAAPVLLARGSLVHAQTRARAQKVAILGVDERFSRLYPGSPPLDFARREGQLFPSVILGASLAAELGAKEGEAVLLQLESRSDLPKETLVGRVSSEKAVVSLRLAVAAVIPDRGPGAFSLLAQQSRTANAFVELPRLQRALDAAGRVNALLIAAPTGLPEDGLAEDGRQAAIERAMAARLAAEDVGLKLTPAAGVVVAESRELVLLPDLAARVEAAAKEAGATSRGVLTYLANRLAVGRETAGTGPDGRAALGRYEGAEAEAGRFVPYSTVAALDLPENLNSGSNFSGEALTLVDGSPAPALAPGEILLDSWAAEDLAAQPGDTVTLTYYELGARDELATQEATFRLRGVVALAGLGADRSLTPELPGLTNAERMGEWDPPFPVDLKLVRPHDEDYWHTYRATPKAFVSLADGQRLWSSRFGALTSLRLAPPAGTSPEALAGKLEAAFAGHLDPAAFGLAPQPVKARALQAAAGATDFSQLFLAFSVFLIVSAALLVGLLFRLGVEQRAAEVGLLLAVGFPRKKVRRQLLAEGLLVGALGALAGLAGAVGYAALMLLGLRTWWLPAIGTPILTLHAEPATLAIGWLAAMLVVALAIVGALRAIGRVRAPALLAGSAFALRGPRSGRRARLVGIAMVVLAAGLLAVALAADQASSPAYAFGIGACLLIAGLAAFAHACRDGVARRANGLGGGGLLALGARNSTRSAGRSLLAVALVASASFVLVAVAANRGEANLDPTDRTSGSGGFALLAESDVPVLQDLGQPAARREMGFAAEAEPALAASRIYPFRLLPGDDASCLNLFQPQKPRVLGVPAELIARGGFSFQALAEKTENPWSLLRADLGPDVLPAFADANSAQWILKLGLGDELTIPDEAGRPLRLRLVGLLSKSLFQSELLVADERLVARFPRLAGASFFLVETPPTQAPAVAQALETALGAWGFDVTTTRERLAAFAAVESTYMATFQTLGGLGLLLGTLGLGVVLLRNVLERRGELATLRAFGFRRGRLAALVVAENAFLLALGLAIGTVSALVAVAPHLLQTAALFHLAHGPWLSLAGTLALVFLVGLTACLLAVRSALRVPLLPALKAE